MEGIDGAPETMSEVKERLKQEASGQDEKLARKARLRQKIIALGRMKAMLGSLREN
jgi:hypothetical protein